MSNLQSYLDGALKKVELKEVLSENIFEDYNIASEVRELIRMNRKSLKITQKQLAERSGVSQGNISKMEKGNSLPSIFILKRIADGLGKRLVIDFSNGEEKI